MQLVAYVRVSTEVQVERGSSLADQEAAIREWAERAGHQVVAVCADEGVSGSNGLDTRKGLYAALSAITAGQAEGLAVYNLDRLARKLTVQEGVLGQVWAGGHKVFSVEDQGEVVEDDPSDPMRTAMRQMRGVFAQLERGMLVMRMYNGRMAKLARGGHAHGAPPFGWQAEGGELVEDGAEQEALHLICELHDQGYSTRTIAEHMVIEGFSPRRAAKWQSTTVAKIIRRVYADTTA